MDWFIGIVAYLLFFSLWLGCGKIIAEIKSRIGANKNSVKLCFSNSLSTSYRDDDLKYETRINYKNVHTYESV